MQLRSIFPTAIRGMKVKMKCMSTKEHFMVHDPPIVQLKNKRYMFVHHRKEGDRCVDTNAEIPIVGRRGQQLAPMYSAVPKGHLDHLRARNEL